MFLLFYSSLLLNVANVKVILGHNLSRFISRIANCILRLIKKVNYLKVLKTDFLKKKKK